jgi:hypothetical protein
MRREAPTELDVASYQRVLDRVYRRSRDLLPSAPSWRAGLYLSVRACYAEMRSEPDALQMHFVVTTSDPQVQQVRTDHRERLLALLDASRDDAPERVQAELALSMIHATIRARIVAGEPPPDVDAAEQTFATVLFRYDATPR